MRQRKEGELGCFWQFIIGIIAWGFLITICGGYILEHNYPDLYYKIIAHGQVSSDDATSTAVDATANAQATQTALTANAQATQTALTPTPSQITVDLLTAVNHQLVTVSFTSNGGASGNVINITLHRFKSQNSDIQVTLPPGLLLTNSDPSEQNMILEGSIEMELSPQDTTTSLDNELAYCVQLHNGNPTDGTSLMLSGQASSDLVSLMKAEAARMDSNSNDSNSVVQAAVWAITDNPTRDDLNQVGYSAYRPYQLSDQDLQSVRDLLRAAGLDPANYQLTA